VRTSSATAGRRGSGVGFRYPNELKRQVGSLLRSMRRGMKRQITRAVGVSPRSARRWQRLDQDARTPKRRPGRPGHSAEVWAAVKEAVLGVLRRLGFGTGERKVHYELDRKYTLYQVREVLRQLKAQWRSRRGRQRRAARKHVRVLVRGAIWSVDGTHLGRDAWGTAAVGEIVRDVASTKTLGVSVGPPPDSHEVVVLLQRVVEATGERPLVVSMDNGPENLDAVVEWCQEQGVVLLRSLPHTPQHNPWVEHGNAEIKQHSGLGKAVLIPHVRDLPDLLRRALDTIDGRVPRTTRGWQTARDAYRTLPSAEALVDRAAFVREAHCAITEAVRDCQSWREERLATRAAILQVLERHAMVITTRGRPPLERQEPDGVS